MHQRRYDAFGGALTVLVVLSWGVLSACNWVSEAPSGSPSATRGAGAGSEASAAKTPPPPVHEPDPEPSAPVQTDAEMASIGPEGQSRIYYQFVDAAVRCSSSNA